MSRWNVVHEDDNNVAWRACICQLCMLMLTEYISYIQYEIEQTCECGCKHGKAPETHDM